MSLAKPTEVKTVSDVELPCFSTATCYVHGLTRGDLLIVRLLTEDNQIFAESFWKPEKPMSSIIDAAMDSSRYFALRVENPDTGSHVFIGIGFADRETAGQFKLTLAEHGRYLQRMQKAERDRLASPSGGPNPLARVSTDATDSPVSSRLSTDSGRSGSPIAMRDLSLHGTVRVDLPNMGEKRGLMAKGRSSGAAGSGAALPLLLRGSSARALLPPPPGPVLCREVSGSHRSDDEDAQARGFSAPGSARSGSSVDMDSTPTATGKQGTAARGLSAMASPQVAAGSTGASSGVLETNVSRSTSVAASAGDTTAADEEFGDFCEAQE